MITSAVFINKAPINNNNNKPLKTTTKCVVLIQSGPHHNLKEN